MSFDRPATPDTLPVPAARGGAANVVFIVHDGVRRLRATAPVLRLPALDTDHLARLFKAMPGVETARINPEAQSLIVTYDGAEDTRGAVLDRLRHLSRGEMRFRGADDGKAPSVLPILSRVALIGLMRALPPTLAMGLTALTVAPRIWGGVTSVFRAGVTVELLDALAVAIPTLRGQYATAVTTDTMMEIGEYLEETTVRRSGALLEDLLMPNPDRAWVERDGGHVEIAFAEVVQGDIVLVNTGELVPVDGQVVGGNAEVNQATITGESVPVHKQPGDTVIAGSLIEQGFVKVAARHVGDDTTTARIAAMIRESLSARSESERLASGLADRQVYVTLALGAATLLFTRDWRRLSAVFLVDYACPIKLSAPVAVRATMSEAARRGILIKGGPSIEKLAAVDTFVFDKTGTLTHGDLTVTDLCPLAPEVWDAAQVLALAASLEEHSQHPLATAIVAEARAQGVHHCDHGDVHVNVGHGLCAEVGGEPVLIGSRHYLETLEGIDFAAHDGAIDRLADQGKMALFVAVGGRPAGLIGVSDRLRGDARDTAEKLRASGVERLIMLTGDRRGRAEALGAALGFDAVHAELRPEDKARILAEIAAAGHKIAFVGDGINDAPALAAASVGFSMARGADLAQATADITLLDDRIGAVAEAREASVQAMRIISQNSNVALGFNSLLFLAASVGLLSPVAAAVAHNGSTIGLLISAMSRAGLADAPDRALLAGVGGAEEILD